MENQAGPARVVVTDIDMPFASMVAFMIKWALASIPAAAGVLLLAALAGAALAAVLGALGFSLAALSR